VANQPPKWLSQLLGWYAMTVLGLGARTGLLDALLAAPGTAAEIAERAGVDERNALQWLWAMASAGHVSLEGDCFALTDETRFVFGPGFPVNARAVVDFVDRTSSVLPEIADAMQSGKGVAPNRFHAAYGDSIGRINTPTYAMALVDEWIGSCEGLVTTLAAGGRIADLASGNGDAAVIMAKAFPSASITAYDLDSHQIEATRARASAEGLGGLTAEAAGAEQLGREAFDLVTCLDSFHHFGDPAAVAAQVRGALAPGGVFLLAESAMSGDLGTDVQNPFSVVVHSAGLLYCLQENLSSGGPGLTGGDGPGWVNEALERAGFTSISTLDSPTGYRVFVART